MFQPIFDAWNGLQAAWASALGILSLWPWFGMAFLVGIVIGAWIGWRGVLVICTLGVGLLVLRSFSGRQGAADDKPDPFGPRNFGVPRKPSTLREPGEPANDWFKRVTGQGGQREE